MDDEIVNRQGILTGWRGDGKTQAAINLRRRMTPQERVLWQYLRANRLGQGLHFRRQQPIDGFIADFYCHSAGVIVEIDGPIHERHQEYDRQRDQVIASRNLRILRFTNAQVDQSLETVVETIRTLVVERRNLLAGRTRPRHPHAGGGPV